MLLAISVLIQLATARNLKAEAEIKKKLTEILEEVQRGNEAIFHYKLALIFA